MDTPGSYPAVIEAAMIVRSEFVRFLIVVPKKILTTITVTEKEKDVLVADG